MLSYVVRRLLYSVVVLLATSFLVFTFVSVSGDPLAALRVTPDYDPNTIKRIEEQNNLDKPVPVRYVYWAKDAVRGDFGTTLLGDRPILPDLWRVMKNTLMLVFVAEMLAVLIAVVIGVFAALRQYSVFDYSATTFSFLGLAMPVFWLALMLQVLVVSVYESTGHPALSDLEPELHRSGNRRRFLDRPRSPSRAARHRPHGREHRDVLAVHARLDARGRQLRLRADGAREGTRREERDDEARVP